MTSNDAAINLQKTRESTEFFFFFFLNTEVNLGNILG